MERELNQLEQMQRHHDDDTARHNSRVAALSEKLAAAIGCGAHLSRRIGEAALIHDIGKILVDAQLINKASSLSVEEREEVKKHTTYAEELLEERRSIIAHNITRYHHERWNGSGYPEGLRADRIPLEAQIVGVADVYDALRSRRSYKRPFTAEESLNRMRHGDDRMPPNGFNPRILDALEELLPEIESEIYTSLAMSPSPA
jgi:HD-GYP domain-containing protein (c-di-GMP phosphodiesterase class II)